MDTNAKVTHARLSLYKQNIFGGPSGSARVGSGEACHPAVFAVPQPCPTFPSPVLHLHNTYDRALGPPLSEPIKRGDKTRPKPKGVETREGMRKVNPECRDVRVERFNIRDQGALWDMFIKYNLDTFICKKVGDKECEVRIDFAKVNDLKLEEKNEFRQRCGCAFIEKSCVRIYIEIDRFNRRKHNDKRRRAETKKSKSIQQ